MIRNGVLLLLMFAAHPLQAQWVAATIQPYAASNFAVQGSSIFAGDADLGGNGSIFKSDDYGKFWYKSDTGVGGAAVFSLYANGSLLLAGTYARGILRSTDHGLTWIPADCMVYCSEILSFVSKGKYLFAGAVKNMTGLVLRSSDGGRHWTETQRVPFGTDINSMVVKDSFVFASDWGDPTYRSSNYGDTWEGLDLPSEGILVVKDSFILSETSKGLRRSSDDGTTWIQIGTGLPPLDSSSITAMATDGKSLFTCALYPVSSLYRSSDDGLNWHVINEGFPPDSREDFDALLIAGGYLLVGSENRYTVWRRPLADFSAVRGDVPSGFALAQNYPNPFNPTTTFSFTLPKSAVVSLIVCDALGNEVSVVNSREMNLGEHHVTWDATSFASGIYTYRLESGGLIQTKKLVILK
jgi:photosystem II stability/assembly factor-like uncharacterized protein